MNIATVFLLFVGFFVAAISSPLSENYPIRTTTEISDKNLPTIFYPSPNWELSYRARYRRATCDLLSFDTKFGSLGHSACAAHCLALRKGFKGGRCRDGVCHCRK